MNRGYSRKFNRKTKLIAFFALIFITCLSIGFGAYTTSLAVSNSTASIPGGTNSLNSDVVFGTSSITTSGASAAGSSVGSASGQTWNSSTVAFTSSIRSVSFKAPVNNNSSYTVYLISMAAGSDSKLSCTSGTGTNSVSSDILSDFCSNTTATYQLGSATVLCNTSGCTTTLNQNSISANASKDATLTVTTSSSALPDGTISISVPGISLGFTTNQNFYSNNISNLSASGSTVTATIKMSNSISAFGLSSSSTTVPSSWLTSDTNGTLSGTTYNLNYTASNEGTYYLWAKDTNGNTIVSSSSVAIIFGKKLDVYVMYQSAEVYVDGTLYNNYDGDNYQMLYDINIVDNIRVVCDRPYIRIYDDTNTSYSSPMCKGANSEEEKFVEHHYGSECFNYTINADDISYNTLYVECSFSE